MVSLVLGTAPFVKIRHVSQSPPRKAVNTHTSLKDRQGGPQWLQTKPLYTINASFVNVEDVKNQKLARGVFDFILIGLLKTRTGMNFIKQVAYQGTRTRRRGLFQTTAG